VNPCVLVSIYDHASTIEGAIDDTQSRAWSRQALP